MVSGLVTSPWDQDRIFSGLAKLMRMESKSAIWLARSYGLDRYKGNPPLRLRRSKKRVAKLFCQRPAKPPPGAVQSAASAFSAWGFWRFINSTSKHSD